MLRALLAAGLGLALAAAASDSLAQSFRCVGKDGRKYYGQTVPPQCAGVPVEQLNKQGVVVKRIDPQADAARQAQKEADESRKRQEDAATKEETRRNRALLATYTSEADIEAARKRALADNERAVQEVETRIGFIKKRQADLAKEQEFYKGKSKPPAKLDEDVKNAEIDLRAQQSLLEAKRKEVNSINAKYDEDKRRFAELTKGGGKK
jgi:hypothetical protein